MAETVKLADEATADLPEDFNMTELGPLPRDWQALPLGETARITMGQSPPSSTYNTDGRGLPFLQGKAEFGELFPTPVKWCCAPRKVARQGSVLISVRAPVGDVNLADTDYCIGRGLACIYGNDKLNNDFLFFYLKFAGKFFEGQGAGTIFNSITKDVLQRFMVPLPPLTEQRAIAYVLRCVKSAKEATQNVLAAARELKKSLMRYLFTYGPVPVEEGARVPLKETEVGLIPTHWDVVRFGDVASFIRGISWRKSDEDPNGVPVVAIPNIKNGRVIFDGLYRIKSKANSSKRLLSGDILLVGSSGSVDNIGRVAIVNEMPFPEVYFASFLVKVQPTERLDKRYLFLLLSGKVVNFASCSKRAADGKYNLQLEALRSSLIPLPSLREQEEIAHLLAAVDLKIQAEEARIHALDTLFKTLLHLLMTGRVRVKDLSLPETEGVASGASRE
ncbi:MULTISPECIES: restriction endonuclease subunit S [Thermaerobacter]|uniref:Restriction endonuclease subunit S n=1 Tax=Thermaerobacter composti TaxID=554949 RepID=A0ABZ0QPS1_9FIRM|nr:MULTISPECIES: restriction endonuclease subunit S [Thermaerobacter]QBS36716.1 restriction endonuclease subunit S [Thermaerobacter sp. FW80]WPD18669.1 restriction endonuclease subunit S [Thermaerobacter composti]